MTEEYWQNTTTNKTTVLVAALLRILISFSSFQPRTPQLSPLVLCSNSLSFSLSIIPSLHPRDLRLCRSFNNNCPADPPFPSCFRVRRLSPHWDRLSCANLLPLAWRSASGQSADCIPQRQRSIITAAWGFRSRETLSIEQLSCFQRTNCNLDWRLANL